MNQDTFPDSFLLVVDHVQWSMIMIRTKNTHMVHGLDPDLAKRQYCTMVMIWAILWFCTIIREIGVKPIVMILNCHEFTAVLLAHFWQSEIILLIWILCDFFYDF